MSKSLKTQRLREKARADVKYSKQTTFDKLPNPKEQPPKPAEPLPKKQIEITELGSVTKEDELVLKVTFGLVPSRKSFSRLTADLYFDDQKIDSLRLRILHGPLSTDESEFSSTLDMNGIEKGPHTFKVEMYELWSSGEKLNQASKEITIDYVPVKREDRLIKIPIIKKTAGADLSIVSETDRTIYRQIDEEMKNELSNRRDYW